MVAMSSKMPHTKRQSRATIPSSSIELLDRLPESAKVLVYVIGVVGFFYCVGHFRAIESGRDLRVESEHERVVHFQFVEGCQAICHHFAAL